MAQAAASLVHTSSVTMRRDEQVRPTPPAELAVSRLADWRSCQPARGGPVNRHVGALP